MVSRQFFADRKAFKRGARDAYFVNPRFATDL
jgi:hypothetical protein